MLQLPKLLQERVQKAMQRAKAISNKTKQGMEVEIS